MADQPLSEWYKSLVGNSEMDDYQIAGVERFESNVEVIRASLTQRAKFANTVVRKAKGDDVADRLIKRLQTIAKCLCNDERRAKYDQQLRREASQETVVDSPSTEKLQTLPTEGVSDVAEGIPQIVTVDPTSRSKRKKAGTTKRQRTSQSKAKVLIGVGLIVVVAVASAGIYFSGGGQPSPGNREVAAPTKADRAFCYLVLRKDVPQQLGLSNTQKMQHALATQIMSGNLNYVVGGIPNAELLPIDTEELLNRVERRRARLDELGASLKRMLTTTQRAKFWVLHASIGLESIEMKKDGKQFRVYFSTESPTSNGQRYESLDTQAAWSHLNDYSDVLELVERCQATTQKLEHNTINSALSWLMQPYRGDETKATRTALADALWILYDDRTSTIDQKHIALGIARVGCGSKRIDDWMKAAETHRLRNEQIVGGLCHFDLAAAGKYIIDAARKDEIHNACVEALLTAGQPAVDVIVEANQITNGRHYGRFAQFVETQGLDASSLVSRQDMMEDPVKGQEIEERMAAQQADANLENYLRTLDELTKIEDEYAPPRAAFNLVSNYDVFMPFQEKHGSPAALLVKYIESQPKADSLGRAVQALSYYASEEHVPTFIEVMNQPEDFHVARAWAAASLAFLSPKDLEVTTEVGFKSNQEIAHFREACVKLDKASVTALAPLLNTSSLEQAIQISHIIAALDQPESKGILTSAEPDSSWSDFDKRNYKATIEQRIRELTADE